MEYVYVINGDGSLLYVHKDWLRIINGGQFVISLLIYSTTAAEPNSICAPLCDNMRIADDTQLTRLCISVRPLLCIVTFVFSISR